MVGGLSWFAALNLAQAQPSGRYLAEPAAEGGGVQEVRFEADHVWLVASGTVSGSALGPVRFTVEVQVPLRWEDDGSLTLDAGDALTELEVLAGATVGAVQARQTSGAAFLMPGDQLLAGAWKVQELGDGRVRLRGPDARRPILLRPVLDPPATGP